MPLYIGYRYASTAWVSVYCAPPVAAELHLHRFATGVWQARQDLRCDRREISVC